MTTTCQPGRDLGLRRRMAELVNRIEGILREAREARVTISGRPSLVRYILDIGLYRVLRVVDLPPRPRTIRLADGSVITYRLNRGDIQTIREVFLGETYRLPFTTDNLDVVIDLGANIGLTSVYLAHRYGCYVLAVEPLEQNAQFARNNLEQNNVRGEVVCAAVGPVDTTGYFSPDRNFNTGRLGVDGIEVPVVSMQTLLDRLPRGTNVDLLKVDIEGAEEALFLTDVGWLDRVKSIIIELHPANSDTPAVIDALVSRGFRHLPVGSVYAGTTDAFLRD